MKKKLIVYYILFTLSVASFFGIFLYYSYSQEKKLTEENTAMVTLLISEWIKGAFNASDYILRDIIDNVPTTALTYPISNPAEHVRISALIDKKRKTLPYANGVGLNDDKCILTHTPSKIGFDASQREWCYIPMQNPKLETYISNMFMSNIGEMMVIQVRKFPNNKGLAGLGVNLNFFSQWINKVNIGRNSVIEIIDSNFKLLARQPDLKNTLGKEVDTPILKKFIASQQQSQHFSYLSPLDDTKRLYHIRKLENHPFIVSLGVADNDWLANWYEQLIMLILITCLLWFIGWLILHRYLYLLTQKKVLEKLSNTDQLTGLYNRRKLNEALQKEYCRAERMQEVFEVIILDIDNFKQINDTYGHNIGDTVLKELASLMKHSIRLSDTLGRWGGEEFLIILPTKMHKAQSPAAEKLCKKIEKYKFTTVNHITASLGVAFYKDGDSINSLIKRADDALYSAKKNGRNQVVVA